MHKFSKKNPKGVVLPPTPLCASIRRLPQNEEETVLLPLQQRRQLQLLRTLQGSILKPRIFKNDF